LTHLSRVFSLPNGPKRVRDRRRILPSVTSAHAPQGTSGSRKHPAPAPRHRSRPTARRPPIGAFGSGAGRQLPSYSEVATSRVRWERKTPRVDPGARVHEGPATGPPDPLDDAVYHYPPLAPRHPHRGPAIRRPSTVPLRQARNTPLQRAAAGWGLATVSVLDLWAFGWSMMRGPRWLIPIALAGSIATLVHLRVLVLRLKRARRPWVPALGHTTFAAAARPPRSSRGSHGRFAPPSPSRRTSSLLRTWGASSLRTSTTLVAAVSLVAAFVVHVAVVHP
jgi:hypothetical protein